MPNYLRRRIDGGMYFLTLVTHQRMSVFSEPSARRLLRQAIDQTRRRWPFELRAIVLLPDHVHMVMVLPVGDSEYSTRLSLIKRRFTRGYLASGGREGPTTPSRSRHRVRGVWEKRFYEHTIRGYKDYKRHVDYVHANPVKHGLVAWPKDWGFSSFHRFVREGEYELDWCGHVSIPGGADIEPDEW